MTTVKEGCTKMRKILKRIFRRRPVDPNEGVWAGYYGTFDTGLRFAREGNDPCSS